MKKLPFFFLFIGLICVSFGQKKPQGFFKAGSRVCFVGNSITNNGGFYHDVFLYHVTRFPDEQITFYNCGISGDVAEGVLKRMKDDVFIHRPTHIALMLGMNDVQRSLYGGKTTTDADTLQRREDAISSYQKNMERVLDLVLSGNIKVILQKPTIFDQTVNLSVPNNLGVNDALKTCAEFIGELADRHGLPVVDYWTILEQVNRTIQKKNPTVTVTGPDRVHPGAIGHFIMAYQFLVAEQAPSYVSKIVIKEDRPVKCLNAEISGLSKTEDQLVFSVFENSLPFPLTEEQEKAARLVPFNPKFNLQILQVCDLEKGTYTLTIDEQVIGSFSEKHLRSGINLAEYKNTPQYLQAIDVRERLTRLWQVEASLRGLKFIEYNPFYQNFPAKENPTLLKAHLDSVFTEKYSSHTNYYKTQLSKYMSNKPRENDLNSEAALIRGQVYRMAQPRCHLYSLKKN
ncbi:MAG: SGNH/GDSL hydrolase family protein [Prolixibacteraceae bacterium]